jgi:hypothetical protein
MATPPIEVADQLSCTHPSVKRGKRPVWRVPNQCLIEESTEPRDQGRSAGPKVDSNQRLAVEVQFGKPSHVLPDDNERLVPREPCGRHEPTVVEQECASATYEYRSEHQRTCPEAQHCSPRHHRPITSGDHRTACRSKNRHQPRRTRLSRKVTGVPTGGAVRRRLSRILPVSTKKTRAPAPHRTPIRRYSCSAARAALRGQLSGVPPGI